jgi:hypothetical protein
MASWSLSARPFAWFNLLSAVGYAGVMASLLAWQNSWRSRASVNTSHHSPTEVVAIFTGQLELCSVPVSRNRYPLVAARCTLPGELRVLLALIVTLLLAVVVNRLVENPLREYGRR